MFCSKCGKELHEGDRFCKNCGAPVGGIPVNTAVQQINMQNQYEEKKNLTNTRKDGSKNEWIITSG